MDPVWIFRHVAYEGPGYLGEFLTARGIPYELIPVDEGAPVPVTPEGASGLVFMGGPMSVNDPLTWVAEETELIRQAQSRGIPVLGHCLGGQLIARALDAPVGPGAGEEIGWYPVERAAGPAAAAWLGDAPARFEAFHWHGEDFARPEEAETLLTNEHTACQGFVHGTSLALQCHLEMTPALVRDWAARNGPSLDPTQPRVQSPTAMAADLEARCRALQAVADRLYGRWAAALPRG